MMRNLFVCVMCLGFAYGAYHLYTRPVQYVDPDFVCNVTIEYSKNYARKDVQQALALLKDVDREQYADLCRYVDTVDSGALCSANGHGRLVGCAHSASHIGLRSVGREPIEQIVATLAHETCHFRFGHQADSIPDYYLHGNLEKHRREEEDRCIQEGIAVLEKLGADIPNHVNPL